MIAFFASLLLMPMTSEAQIIALPDCDLFPNDPFCAEFNDEKWKAVIFIPGLQGSRLYTQGSFFENQLWEPNWNADVVKLYMDEFGHSINNDIYTNDIIDEAFGYNIYKKFISFMDEMVDDNVITTWRAMPYDWRYDIDDDLNSLIEELESLDNDYDVTIITHSNGGLVVKALLQKLEEEDSYLLDSVDRVIMVAAPQLGTPKAIASMLHGYDLDQAKGIILNKKTARGLAEHMPSAFNLLPAPAYFDNVLDPVVEFDESVDKFTAFSQFSGTNIHSPLALKNFLTGAGGQWLEPDSGGTFAPNVLKTHFLDTAAVNHDMLEKWTPPENVEVVQIAGWGLDTLKTIKYTAKRSFFCRGNVSPFCRGGYILDHEPVFTTEGDKTVVSPSAIAMEGETYYVNLEDHNKELFGGRRNRSHADILEAWPLQEMIQNILAATNELPDHVTTAKPTPSIANERIRVSVHSPVSLGIHDSSGNYTGIIPNPDPDSDLTLKEELIPNSYYMEFGEGKYGGFGTEEKHTLDLKGTGTGSFTLKISEVTGDEITETLEYEDIPVFESSIISMTLQNIADASDLTIDMDGDGQIDYSLSPGQSLEPTQLLDILKAHIFSLNVKKGTKKSSEAHIKNAKKFIKKGKDKPLQSQLKNIEKKIQKEKKISQEDINFVSETISIIKNKLEL